MEWVLKTVVRECLWGLFQAQVLVCRALSNILLLPCPNLSESEQQWPMRSMNHANLIFALSRDYRNLKPSAAASQRKMPLDDSKCLLGRGIPGRWVNSGNTSTRPVS